MTSVIKILAAMPAPRTTPVGGIWCSECEHEREERDPNGTGDAWHTVRVCGLPDFTPCPYGKLEPDQE